MLMENYFLEERQNKIQESLPKDVPISPKKQKWEMTKNPEALRRTFELSSAQQLIYFLEDLIQMQESMGHHGKMLIDRNAVTVQVSTHSLERVTDLDVEWAAKVDEIYEDVESTSK